MAKQSLMDVLAADVVFYLAEIISGRQNPFLSVAGEVVERSLQAWELGERLGMAHLLLFEMLVVPGLGDVEVIDRETLDYIGDPALEVVIELTERTDDIMALACYSLSVGSDLLDGVLELIENVSLGPQEVALKLLTDVVEGCRSQGPAPAPQA